jgi:hypothetical protein
MRSVYGPGPGLKIKLDECISNRVALAIMQVTANREGYEVSFVRAGHGGTDPQWIRAFVGEGGTAIVSGDHDILQHWPNLIALYRIRFSFVLPAEGVSKAKWVRAGRVHRPMVASDHRENLTCH